MHQLPHLSRRRFLLGVSALAGAMTGCGGGNGGAPSETAVIQGVDTTNTTKFINDFQTSMQTGTLAPSVKAVFAYVQTNFTADQITALSALSTTLADSTQTQQFLQPAFNPQTGQFNFPAPVQQAIQKAQANFPALPDSGGLPTVTTQVFTGSRGENVPERAIQCIAGGILFALALNEIPGICSTPNYNRCTTLANAVCSTAVGELCAVLTAMFAGCVAGAVFTFGFGAAICAAALVTIWLCGAVLAASTYYTSMQACAKFCGTGAAGNGG